MDEQRSAFFRLVRVLAKSPYPYTVAEELMRQTLLDVDALRVELGEFLDDLVLLGRLKQIVLPESFVAELRIDLARMAQEPRKIGILFQEETREQCGLCAIPILAAAIVSAWNWVEFASDSLESMDELRIRADALLCQLSGRSSTYRRNTRPCS